MGRFLIYFCISHTFYDIIDRHTGIPVPHPLLCGMFPLDRMLGAAVDAGHTVLAAVKKFRLSVFQYNIPVGAYVLANTTVDTSIIRMESRVSVQLKLLINVIKHSVPNMEPKWPVMLGCNHF